MAQIVYEEGKWFTPLHEAVQAFVDVTQQYALRSKFKLYKETSSKRNNFFTRLYVRILASFTTGELYDHHDAGRIYQPVWTSSESAYENGNLN